MEDELNEASRWRIQFARELAGYYSGHGDVETIVLGGSPSRGLSDRYSDLDVVAYWSKIDRPWIEAEPLREVECERAWYKIADDGGFGIESYYFGPLKADIGHVALSAWEKLVEGVIDRHETDGGAQQSIAGLLDARVLYGEELAARLKARVADYPDGLATAMVRRHLRFFVPGYLERQAHGRGDLLAYRDGVCLMLKSILCVLAGLNRVYYSADEPRWVRQDLDRMRLKPPGVWERFLTILEDDPSEAMPALEGLLADVIDLVAAHLSEVDVSRARLGRTLEVLPCDEKPEIRPRARRR